MMVRSYCRKKKPRPDGTGLCVLLRLLAYNYSFATILY